MSGAVLVQYESAAGEPAWALLGGALLWCADGRVARLACKADGWELVEEGVALEAVPQGALPHVLQAVQAKAEAHAVAQAARQAEADVRAELRAAWYAPAAVAARRAEDAEMLRWLAQVRALAPAALRSLRVR